MPPDSGTGSGSPSLMLIAAPVSVDLSNRLLRISVSLPRVDSLAGPSQREGHSSVELSAMLDGLVLPGLPLSIPVFAGGMCPPLSLSRPSDPDDTVLYPTPAVSADGRLFVPAPGSVAVWGPCGERLSTIRLPAINRFLHCVAVDDTSQTLLVSGNRLVALDLRDPTGGPPKWESEEGAGEDGGIASLPAQGLIVVTSYNDGPGSGWTLRVADGLKVSKCPELCCSFHVSAEPATAMVFVSSCVEEGRAYRWSSEAVSGFHCVDPPVLLGSANFQPLAVLPARADVGLPACLVVATWGSPTLSVFALPDYKVLHRHRLSANVREDDDDDESSVDILGIAGDPVGVALVICTRYGYTLVLPWPLPGMPAT